MADVTMKDIAQAAHVSTATVSYILNNVKTQKISEQTRARVLDLCEKMGYLPNLTARTLASRKSGLVGVLRVQNPALADPWEDFLYAAFIRRLERLLLEHGYHIIITSVDMAHPAMNIILQRELEGVVLLDVGESMFYRISQKFSVPILVVDGYFDDNLFHKVVFDYKGALQAARQRLGGQPAFLIANAMNNRGVREALLRLSGLPEEAVCFAESEEQLTAFAARHRGEKGVAVGEFVALFAARALDADDLCVICTGDSASLLPSGWKTVRFSAGKAKTVAQVLLAYIRGDIPDSDQKYTLIPVE